MKTILIVDDDLHIGNMLQEVLIKEGYAILRAYSGTEAILLLSTQNPDLMLLDLMLPGLSGEEVLTKANHIPVIVVSAKVDINSKVNLLTSGAVDYITKPFDNRELLARISLQLNRAAIAADSTVIVFKELTLLLNLHTAVIDNVKIKLTPTEFAILKLLMQNPQQVITKSQIIERIAQDTPDCTDSSLKMHISNLRKKLRDINNKDYIEAVWGIGFKMRSE